jgi:hypothetical protein
LAITTTGVLVFGSPAALKAALKDSGAYNAASSHLAQQAGKAVNNQSAVTLDQTTVQSAAQQNFSAQTVESNTESVVDNMYGWLQGKTAKPEFKLDLSPYVGQFTQSVGDQTVQHVASLPICTAEQLRQIDPNNININQLPCRPPGVDLNTAKQQAIDQVVQSNSFLSNPVISSDTLPKDAEGKTALDRADSLPGVFQWTMRGPWIFGGLAVLCAALIMWLLWSESWRTGVRKLARSLVGVAITLLLIVLITKLSLHFVTSSDSIAGKLVNKDFQQVLITFAKSLEQAYDSKLLTFGIVYAAVGIVALLVLRFWKPAAPSPVVAGAPATALPPAPDAATTQEPKNPI